MATENPKKSAAEAEFGYPNSNVSILHLQSLVRLVIASCDVITLPGTAIANFGGASTLIATEIRQTQSGFVVTLKVPVQGFHQIFVPMASVSYTCPLPEKVDK